MALKVLMFDEECQIDRMALAEGQRPTPGWPRSGVLSGSGEHFQVRLAGNNVYDDGTASLEYAVAVLGVPLILVPGHSRCGGVKDAMASEPLSSLLE